MNGSGQLTHFSTRSVRGTRSHQLPARMGFTVSQHKLVPVLFVREPAGRVHPRFEWLGLRGLVVLRQASETRQLLEREDLEKAKHEA